MSVGRRLRPAGRVYRAGTRAMGAADRQAERALRPLMPVLTRRIGARFILGSGHHPALKTGHYKPDDNWNAVIT